MGRRTRIIEQEARRVGIDPSLLYGVWGAETNFGRNVRRSSAGAQGDFQFMPATARSLGVHIGNFRSEARGAAKYLSQYRSRGRRGMLAAYNAGPAGNPNNPETRAYVPKVLKLARGFKGGGGGGAGGGQGGVSGSPGTVGAQNVAMGSEGALAMLAALKQEKPPIQSAGLQQPGFSAQAVLPAGYQAPSSGGGPQPKSNVDELLAAIQTKGGDVPLAPGMPGVGGLPGGKGTGGGKGDAFVAAVRQEANHIDQAKVPYSWGGGHSGRQKAGSKVTPLDCSGAVSRVLGVDPRVSGEFEKWGKPGKGRVTVYANKTHVLMEVDGHFWGTSKSNPGGGAGWIRRSQISKDYLRNFTARHA